jgi:exonuclease SbcD
MKILHTSDWHLGRMLYAQKRYEEFEAFLKWLNEFIVEQKIDVLLVAGDIFDTTTPSNKAQELYYQFLSRTMHSCCRHVVVIGGNHDSPTLLNAPKDVLRALNVHVVGEMTENMEDEVITLRDAAGQIEAIVGTVPFLRDRDVRQVEAGENMDDKTQKLMNGIAGHYKQIGELIERQLNEAGKVPVVGMGHLFTSGGTVTEGDGTRELYVGTALKVEKNIFPPCFDYVALGHLHSCQTVGLDINMRYSGSPISMGFNEANQEKKVIVIEFESKGQNITEHTIPNFQSLVQIKGKIDQIIAQINLLKAEKTNAWLEIECTEISLGTDLNEQVNNALKNTEMKVLRLKNKQIETQVLTRADHTEELENLEPTDVFERCMIANKVDVEKMDELRTCYREILAEMENKDVNAN